MPGSFELLKRDLRDLETTIESVERGDLDEAAINLALTGYEARLKVHGSRINYKQGEWLERKYDTIMERVN